MFQIGAELEQYSQKWNTIKNPRTALPVGVYLSIPLHCGILFYPASFSTLQIIANLGSFSSLLCSHCLLKRCSQIAYNRDLLSIRLLIPKREKFSKKALFYCYYIIYHTRGSPNFELPIESFFRERYLYCLCVV